MTEQQYKLGVKLTDGVWKGVPINTYHSDCCDGPSVSKSALKWLFPAHEGSPKKFWAFWDHNPNRIVVQESRNEALTFGKAAHCLLLGDEVFDEAFIVRPDVYGPEKKKWNMNAIACKEWVADATDRGLLVLSMDQIELIKRMADELSKYKEVQQGALNGRVERTMIAKDPATGIYLKARPDAIPTADGIFSDLKTTASLNEDFLERQLGDAGYYLQAAMIRKVCRILDIPFEEMYFIYVLKGQHGFTDVGHTRLLDFNLDRGERVIDWCLERIRRGLDTNQWPGAEPFNNGERPAQIKPWLATQIDEILDRVEIEEQQNEPGS